MSNDDDDADNNCVVTVIILFIILSLFVILRSFGVLEFIQLSSTGQTIHFSTFMVLSLSSSSSSSSSPWHSLVPFVE